ncbi:MAG: GspH/FimT family pseudopilin [Burkholderiaceae bacterium]
MVARTSQPHSNELGFTLVELLVVISITAVLMAIAIPAFSSILSSSRLRGVADGLMADLRFAMTESTKRGSDLWVSFQNEPDGSNWCYGLSLNNSCDCRTANDCVIDGIEKVSQANPALLADPSSPNYVFKPKRSTVTAGNITFHADNGKEIRVVISGYGRIRPCSPAGAAYLSGYPTC